LTFSQKSRFSDLILKNFYDVLEKELEFPEVKRLHTFRCFVLVGFSDLNEMKQKFRLHKYMHKMCLKQILSANVRISKTFLDTKNFSEPNFLFLPANF